MPYWHRCLALVVLLAAGCASESPPVACADDVRAEPYAPGLVEVGELYSITLVQSVPAPPAVGDNDWTLEIADTTGDEVDGLHLRVRPYMPDHDHVTPVRPVVTAAGRAGRYDVDPVNLWMPGYWEVNIDVDVGGNDAESLMLPICVDDE